MAGNSERARRAGKAPEATSAAPLTTVEIVRLSAEGEGVGMVGGREVLVPRVIPGERVKVNLGQLHGGRAESEPVEVLSASPHRVVPRCRHFGPCGGCAWQHIDYGEQLRLKQSMMQELADRAVGRGRVRVSATVPSPGGSQDDPTPWGYRKKVSFVFAPGDRRGSLVMGHYRRASRLVLPVVECPVHSETGNAVAFALRDALLSSSIPGSTPDGAAGIARHVVVRVAEETGDWLATLVVTENVRELRRVTARFVKDIAGDERAFRPGARTGFHLNLHHKDDPFLFGRDTRRLHGASEIRERLAGVTFLLAPTAFFQTNVWIAAAMAEHVLAALPADEFARVLDLYSGVGLFALPLAARGTAVTAVEENRDAVAAAVAARRFNRLQEGRLKVVAGRVEASLARLAPRDRSESWDAVVMDPPRQGCPPEVLDSVLNRLRPRRIVYVSCNPAVLADDLREALAAGYEPAEVVPFDMFPHTAHIETVAVLDRPAATG